MSLCLCFFPGRVPFLRVTRLFPFLFVLCGLCHMAQLPPKIPNMTPAWPDFFHHKVPSSMANNNINNRSNVHNPSWVDEFLDFSSARRGTHRRSVSDSITYLEAPMLDECRGAGAAPGSGSGSGSGNITNSNHHEFDKFDDEQFMSMFTDDLPNATVPPTLSSSNPSTPSDHNSINDEKDAPSDQKQQTVRNESDEVQSRCKTEAQGPPHGAAAASNSSDRIVDPKRVKR